MINLVRACLDAVTRLLAPPYCMSCEKLIADYTVLCVSCRTRVPRIAPQQVQLSATWFLTVHAYTAYVSPFDKLIQAKLVGHHIPVHQLGVLLADYVRSSSITADMLVPVPLHWQRRLKRGFNQAGLLADEVQGATSIPVADILVRSKKTAYQSSLSAPERQENLHNAFSVPEKNRALVKNKRILLVDDLYTTGATACAAARTLYHAGADSVELLVACKVLN